MVAFNTCLYFIECDTALHSFPGQEGNPVSMGHFVSSAESIDRTKKKKRMQIEIAGL